MIQSLWLRKVASHNDVSTRVKPAVSSRRVKDNINSAVNYAMHSKRRPKSKMGIFLWIFGVLFLIFIAGLGVAVDHVLPYSILRPYRSRLAQKLTPQSFGLNAEKLDFIPEAGIELKGWFIHAKAGLPIGTVICSSDAEFAKKTCTVSRGYRQRMASMSLSMMPQGSWRKRRDLLHLWIH